MASTRLAAASALILVFFAFVVAVANNMTFVAALLQIKKPTIDHPQAAGALGEARVRRPGPIGLPHRSATSSGHGLDLAPEGRLTAAS